MTEKFVQSQRRTLPEVFFAPAAAVATLLFGVCFYDGAIARADDFTFAGIAARAGLDASHGCSFEVVARSAGTVIEQFSLAGPPRLVVDLKNERIPRNRTFEIDGNSCASAIRFGVQPHGTRVVFDLIAAAPSHYDASTANGRFRARFDGSKSEVGGFDSNSRDPGADSESGSPLPSATATSTAAPTTEPTASPTSVPTPTETPSPSPTPTSTRTPPPTNTPTAEPSATPEPTLTPQPIPTEEPSPEPTATATATPPRREASVVDSTAVAATRSFAIAEHAALKFQVDRVVVEFKPEDRPVQNIVVTNTSDELLQMSARVRAVEFPGGAEEREVETKAILVSPLFFSLEPGASRQVRLVGIEEPDEIEQVFRVTLSPGRMESDPQARVTVGGTTAQLSVVTAFAVTVLRAPEEAEGVLTTNRDGPDIVVKNEGQRSIALTEIKLCRSAASSSCQEYPARRLYAGNSWRVAVPAEGRLEILKRVGKDFQTIVIEGAAR